MATLKSEGIYVVINAKAHTAMDLSGQDHRSVIGYWVHRGENQKWTFVRHLNGWTIQNRYNWKYLDTDLPDADEKSERVIVSNNPQGWDVEWDDQFQGYRIFVHDTNVNVDLSDYGNSRNGTPVVVSGKWAGENQVWRLEEV